MHKLKKPLIFAAGALVLAAAAVVGILTLVKTTPWELTYHLVPSDVTSVILWQGSTTAKLTDDEIISVVHLLNQFEKSSYSIKYGYAGPKPMYGLIIQCGDVEIHISQSPNPREALVMTFDKTTSKTFISGQWYVNGAELKSTIETLLKAKAAEMPQP
jgi:hypothetical protein